MEASSIISILESKIAFTSGGTDRDGRPLLFVTAFSESQSSATLDKFDTLLQYLASLFSPDTRNRGLCVVVDATRGPWRIARNIVRQVSTTLGTDIGCFLVLRHDAFWDNCTRAQRDGEPIFIPVSRLQKFIDLSQLPEDYSGEWPYEHSRWIANRIDVEEFVKGAEHAISELERLRTKLIGGGMFRLSTAEDMVNLKSESFLYTKNLGQKILNIGDTIVQRLVHLSGQDQKDTKDRIERLINVVKGKLNSVEQTWMELQRKIIDAKEVEGLEDGVRRVTDWILGAGESMLVGQQDVGYDISSAEDLRQAHNALELQCRETYGHYAELVHKIDQLIQNGINWSEDLKSQREFMDFVCRSFATRLERRRNILITSTRFFRLVSEYFQTTSEVYEQLVMSCDLDTMESAHTTLIQLQISQETIDGIENALTREGEKLSDLLSMPVKDSFGRDLGVTYENDIVNIKEILDMTVARKSLFRDSVELQRLTLQQVTYIFSYETDATQAVQWLEDLFGVMCKHHSHVGCTEREIQVQKEQHQVLQETAKSTFEYGCQLLRAALALRQSCKFLEDHTQSLTTCLYKCWNQLNSVAQEQLTRLRVSAVFYRNVKEQCTRLHELMDVAKSTIGTSKSKVRRLLTNRERLLLEIGRMVRLGRLLKSRLREPLTTESKVDDNINETAIEAISEKLAEIALLAEELDKILCTHDVIKPQPNDLNISKLYSDKPDKATDIVPSEEMNLVHPAALEPNTILTPSKSNLPEDFPRSPEHTSTPPSRSSSFHTASEGDAASPWWEMDPSSDPEQENVSPNSRNMIHVEEPRLCKSDPTDIIEEVNNNEIPINEESEPLHSPLLNSTKLTNCDSVVDCDPLPEPSTSEIHHQPKTLSNIQLSNSSVLSSGFGDLSTLLENNLEFCQLSTNGSTFFESNISSSSTFCESTQSTTSSSGFHEATISLNNSSCLESSVQTNSKFQQLTKQALTGVF